MKIQRENNMTQLTEEAGEAGSDQWKNQYMESENYDHNDSSKKQ